MLSVGALSFLHLLQVREELAGAGRLWVGPAHCGRIAGGAAQMPLAAPFVTRRFGRSWRRRAALGRACTQWIASSWHACSPMPL